MARSFDGTAGQVFQNGATPSPSTTIDDLKGHNKMTMTAWFKRDAVNSIITINIDMGSGTEQVFIFVRDNGEIALAVRNGGNTWGYFSNNDTDWHHIALVYDGTESVSADRIKGYLDGVEQSLSQLGTHPTSMPNNDNRMIVGSIRGSALTDGEVAEVRIWDTALGDGEIIQDMQGLIPRQFNVVGHWRMGYSATEYDWSKSGQNLTAVTSAGSITDHPGIGPYWSLDEQEILKGIFVPGYVGLVGPGLTSSRLVGEGLAL